MPGVGISIGLSRLFFLLTDYNIISANEESITDVLVISLGENYEEVIKIAAVLRENGIKAGVNVENQKINKKFKYADKINTKFIIVIGEEEIKNNVVSLKNMQTGEQQTLSLEKTIEFIKQG